MKMGAFFMWFQCNDVAELEKERDKKLARIEELKEEVEAINEKIADLKG
jgi:cell division protein FtsB